MRSTLLKVLAACTVLSGGCTKDLTPEYDGPGSGTGAGAGEAMQLTLRVPGIAGGAASYAASAEQECTVDADELFVLLYMKGPDDKYIFKRVAVPENLQRTDNPDHDPDRRYYTMDIPFVEGETGVRFIATVVAGLSGAELEALGGGAGYPDFTALNGQVQDEREIVTLVEQELSYTVPGKTQGKAVAWPAGGITGAFQPFPMWGRTGDFQVRSGADIGTIKLTRATARIDVGVNFLKNADGSYTLSAMQAEGLGGDTYFALENLRVYRTPGQGRVAPDKDNWDEVNQTALNATAFPAVEQDPVLYGSEMLTLHPNFPTGAEAATHKCFTRTVYVPEAENHGLESDASVALVVGGRFGSATAAPTYYRVDIYQRSVDADGNPLKPTKDTRLDILRNHAYVVNIISVAGPGTDTPEEALKSDHTNMTVEVLSWNQDDQLGDITTDGVYVLNVDKTYQEYYADGSAVEFNVETDYDGELGTGWTMEADATAQAAVRFYDNKGKEIKWGDPEWPSQGKNGSTRLRIGMTEFYQAAGETNVKTREAVLTFKAGRMKVRVRLRQSSLEVVKITFTPEELNYGNTPQQPSHVAIDVSTKRDYTMTVRWLGQDGTTTHEWDIIPADTDPFPDPRFAKENFFAVDPEGGYLLMPEPLTDGVARSFKFDFEVTVPALDNTVAKGTLYAYQSTAEVSWFVENGLGRYKNQVFALYNGAWETGQQPKVSANSTLVWWFTRGAGMGPNPEWIYNLATVMGKKQTGGWTMPTSIQVQPKTDIGRRSYLLQAKSTEGGFDESSSTMEIVQYGLPLVLRPQTSPDVTITGAEDPDRLKGTEWTRDFKGELAPAQENIDMTSNTDWYWSWNKGTDGYTGKGSETWDDVYAQMFGSWTSKTAERVKTTDGPKDGTVEKTWMGHMTERATPLTFGTHDQLAPQGRNVPVAGERTLRMELRNANPQLEAEDVEQYASSLTFKREMPAYTNELTWPFDPETNLDQMYDEGRWTPALVSLWTNATGKLQVKTQDLVTAGAAEDIAAEWDVASTNDQGYARHTKKMTELLSLDENSQMAPKTRVRLAYTGERRPETNGGNDLNQTVEIGTVDYYYGMQILPPARNMETGQIWLSAASHDLKFDFADSYFLRLKVRLKVENHYSDYELMPEAQRETTYYPDADGYTIEYAKGTLWEPPTVEANTNLNTLRKITVEYFQTNPDDGTSTWVAMANPEIWQDGSGVDIGGGLNIIYRQTPTFTFNHTFNSNNPRNVLRGRGPADTRNGNWTFTHITTNATMFDDRAKIDAEVTKGTVLTRLNPATNWQGSTGGHSSTISWPCYQNGNPANGIAAYLYSNHYCPNYYSWNNWVSQVGTTFNGPTQTNPGGNFATCSSCGNRYHLGVAGGIARPNAQQHVPLYYRTSVTVINSSPCNATRPIKAEKVITELKKQ